MISSLYTAVSGLIAQEAKQDVITNNLANVNTNGFKQDNVVIKKFNDVLISNYDKIVNGKNVKNVIGSLSQGSSLDEVSTDFSSGTLQTTNVSTDFAIDGKGFFTVAKSDGTGQFYTRDGHFNIDNNGMLVDESGNYVLGKNNTTNNIEPINVGNGTLGSDSDGNISINNVPKYKLATAQFDNESLLKKVGDNLYSGPTPNGNTNTKVVQNSLEKSNVNIMTEMVNMMTTMRTFETNQKIIQSIDETLGKTVTDVGTAR